MAHLESQGSSDGLEDPFPEIDECPYVVGNMIPLDLKTPQHETTVQAYAQITHVFHDFTCSCAMLVQINCPALGMDGQHEMVLKVFDRRFADTLRWSHNAETWTVDLEDGFIDFANSARGSSFIRSIHEGTEKPPRSQKKLWSTSHTEAYLDMDMTDLYNAEKKAYKLLQDLQGTDIPRFIADALVPFDDSMAALPETHLQGFPAVIVEYVPGFFLASLHRNGPEELRQSICDQASRIVGRVEQLGVLNRDIQPGNFLVNIDAEEPLGFKVTMIDFGQCDFRDECDDEEEWEDVKREYDELMELPLARRMEDWLDCGIKWHSAASLEDIDEDNEDYDEDDDDDCDDDDEDYDDPNDPDYVPPGRR
ncbi:hypothetical protein N7488_005219 [Penicillium malachiteum]|nr:hypothetical protein N7488_005219 [Penicillium malachiteum]